MIKRVFLIVLDSLGIGELPDAAKYGDEGSNTLKAISKSQHFIAPNLTKLGLFNTVGLEGEQSVREPLASFARLNEKSQGKDTTIGHWEIAGCISNEPMPTYPNGFPMEIIEELERRTGRKIICNKPYSGTEVIKDFGQEHMETGSLIVYTSADSVFQIAAHVDVVPLKTLYSICQMARDILTGKDAVGRVIARPFDGKYPFHRTNGRHDYSLAPQKITMLDVLSNNNLATISVGKIADIFAGRGISESNPIKSNVEGMEICIALQKKDFNGLCFVNLVDFDMLYGHRNDVDGYAKAVSEFDVQLNEFLLGMKSDDVLIITADHGCDPSTESTDHSREYVPMLIYGENIKANVNLNVRDSFADIAATILEMFNLPNVAEGNSFFEEVYRK
ncbi:MAG TPA: phosphopentomutase [Clostridia bacterium]|nr:phosphopentomutase [Clostridia bacterium]